VFQRHLQTVRRKYMNNGIGQTGGFKISETVNPLTVRNLCNAPRTRASMMLERVNLLTPSFCASLCRSAAAAATHFPCISVYFLLGQGVATI
jgi:hypothetical protein